MVSSKHANEVYRGIGERDRPAGIHTRRFTPIEEARALGE